MEKIPTTALETGAVDLWKCPDHTNNQSKGIQTMIRDQNCIRNKILNEITRVQIEYGENSGDYASHSMELSDEFERCTSRYHATIRDLYVKLKEYPYKPPSRP
jgi:hypothetical protein